MGGSDFDLDKPLFPGFIMGFLLFLRILFALGRILLAHLGLLATRLPRIQHFPKFDPLFEWKVSSRLSCALYSTERPRITTIQLMLDFAECV
jgi:hypothetical protein